ncbi:MAG: hypothetical protein SGI72_07960 [Planctomycetota bacterium]|nr:hypothetical protein [Planctomycetota bacterium]
MNSINHVVTAVFDVLLWPLEKWGRGPALVIVAGVFGVLALFAFKYVSNQKAIARVKDKIKAHLIEIRLYSDDPRLFLRAIGKTLWANARYLMLNLLPFVPLSIPFSFVIAQCVVRYAFDPLKLHATEAHMLAGQGATFRITLERNSAASVSRLSITYPDGLKAVSPLVRIPGEGVAFQEFIATRAGSYDVELAIDSARVTKRVDAGDVVPRSMQPERASGFFDNLLWPAEDSFPSNSPFRRIAFEYRDADLGWLPSGPGGVVLVFLVSSMLFGALAIKPLKISI